MNAAFSLSRSSRAFLACFMTRDCAIKEMAIAIPAANVQKRQVRFFRRIFMPPPLFPSPRLRGECSSWHRPPGIGGVPFLPGPLAGHIDAFIRGIQLIGDVEF